MPVMGIIRTQKLTRTYGRHRGINELDLDVPRGSVYGFLGPNGAGKTTAIRVLLGFLKPTAGSALILDHDCWRDGRSIKQDVGYLPGDLRLYPWMTGETALRWVGQVRRCDVLTHGRELSEDFGLDLSRRMREMSRGTRQKLGLVLAMAHRPTLLILDEPTASLDPIMQQKLHVRLRRLADNGHTVFFSSHTLSEVDRLCDHVAIVREGELVAEGPLSKLRAKAGHWVTVRWKDEASGQTEPPVFLKLSQREGRLWIGELDGPVDRFVSWLHGRAIEDLSIGPPDLESLFHHYYENGDDR
jgi:ABC-2 type transport system ATP-binding protein